MGHEPAVTSRATPCEEGTVRGTGVTTTSAARSVIRRVSGHPRLGKESGLRIATAAEGHARLRVRAAPEPRRGDDVVECDGGRLFLGRHVPQRLHGRVLDAVTERSGRVQFVLRGQR
jgi:Fe-S cluster assembly iron-binding protein IscA